MVLVCGDGFADLIGGPFVFMKLLKKLVGCSGVIYFRKQNCNKATILRWTLKGSYSSGMRIISFVYMTRKVCWLLLGLLGTRQTRWVYPVLYNTITVVTLYVWHSSDTFLHLPHLPDGVKSAHLTARESVNIDDLINCDFFMMLSAGLCHVETQTDGYIYIVTLLWLKSNCLLDCPAVPPWSPLHMAHMKVSSPWPCMFVIMFIKRHSTT